MKIYEKRSAAEEFFTEKLGQKPEETYLVQNPRYQCAWRCRLGEINYISLTKGEIEEYTEQHRKAKYRRVKKGDYILVEGDICHYKHYTIHCSVGDMCVNKKAYIANAECLTNVMPEAKSARLKILPLKVLTTGKKHELVNVIWGIYGERNTLLRQFNFIQITDFPRYNPRAHTLKAIHDGDEFQLNGTEYHAYMEKGLLTLGKFEQLVDIATPKFQTAAGGRR